MMDEDSYYRFSIPAMELEGNSEYLGYGGVGGGGGGGEDEDESLSQSISLPSLPVSLQEQLVYPEMVSSSNKNQVMSMKEIDEKLNALRRENFDLKLRLYCSSQNKGFPRFADKYFNSCSTQTDADVIKPPNLELFQRTPSKSSQSSQTVIKSTSDCGVQTNPIESHKENKQTSTDQLIVSSVSIQTDSPPTVSLESDCEKLNLYSDPHVSHFKSIQLRLNEQLNPKSSDSPRQLLKESVSKPFPAEPQSNLTINVSSGKPITKSPFSLKMGYPNCELSLITSQSSSILQQLSFNSDKTVTPPKPNKDQVKNVGFSEVEYLAGEIDSRISMLTNLAVLSKSKNRISLINSPLNKSTNCDEIRSILKSNSKSNHVNNNESLHQTPSKPNDSRTSGKNNDHNLSRPISGSISGIEKRPLARLNYHRDESLDINHNLLPTKPTSKRLSRICYDSENHHFVSPDLGIGDSDQDLNSDLKAYIPLGYYQLLRCNLHQLSSHLNYLDNLYRDCFLLQSISLAEYSTEMKPSLTHLNQTINSSRNICKNFTIEDENSISLRLNQIKAKKESMERAISRQLRKTDKLLRKAKANLMTN